jgi:Domain of unknown function DUF83
LCTAQNHSSSPDSSVLCSSISSGGNLLYIPVERETLFRVSLASNDVMFGDSLVLKPCINRMTYLSKVISKTDYVLWRVCSKNAWLRIHKPELYCSTELTEFEQSVIDMGIEVERVARNLFPQGMLVTGTRIEAQQNTLKWLSSNPAGTLFQAVFQREQLLAAVDVLQCDAETGWYSIQEIKSSTEVKEEHLYDLAFQVVLLRQRGMSIRRASIVHLNPRYVRQGDLDIQQLFTTVDVTARVDQISGDVIKEVQEARAYL